MPVYVNETSLAQNGTMEIPLTKGKASAVTIKTGSGNNASAAVQLLGDMGDDDPIVVATINPADAVTVQTSLTGASKCGVVPLNIAGFEKLYVKRTDGAGGVCIVRVGVQDY